MEAACGKINPNEIHAHVPVAVVDVRASVCTLTLIYYLLFSNKLLLMLLGKKVCFRDLLPGRLL